MASDRSPEPAASDTRERILAEAESLLRRFGPEKLTVTDIARRCGMSHSNVYRFFASKSAIFDAITERWLGDAERALGKIAAEPGPAAARVEAFVLTLHRIKRRKVIEDRELFAAYSAIAEGCREVVGHHLDRLRGLLRRIVAEGVAAGEFETADVDGAVEAIEIATMRFRHPRLIMEYLEEPTEAQARAVLRLLLAGLVRGRAPS